MLTWFKKKKANEDLSNLPFVDVHSHLLPGLDDGVQSFEEAEQVILHFQSLGYKKLITTPHVMSDFYRNSSETILDKLAALTQYLSERKIAIEIKAAAEYYLDEGLFEKLESNTPLLTFGEKFLLFETNFMTEPLNMKEFIFTASTKGYRPVLAHPERYLYLQSDFKKVEELLDRGVLFQLNIASISGHYSKTAQRLAHKLIDNKWVQLLGSDCHNMQHIAVLEETITHKYFQKAISLPLLNNSL